MNAGDDHATGSAVAPSSGKANAESGAPARERLADGELDRLFHGFANGAKEQRIEAERLIAAGSPDGPAFLRRLARFRNAQYGLGLALFMAGLFALLALRRAWWPEWESAFSVAFPIGVGGAGAVFFFGDRWIKRTLKRRLKEAFPSGAAKRYGSDDAGEAGP